ncbi:MAG: PTS sugar transporter subunit IIA [Pseudomonadota bacterium]
MTLLELLNAERILCGADISSKKRALQQLTELLAVDGTEVADRIVYDRLCSRERLGSTGLGSGIAIPHGRVPGLTQPRAALVTLGRGIEFDAIDGEPVDLLVGLLVPEDAEEAHLQILAHLAGHLSDAELCARIRSAETPADVLSLFSPDAQPDSAASG